MKKCFLIFTLKNYKYSVIVNLFFMVLILFQADKSSAQQNNLTIYYGKQFYIDYQQPLSNRLNLGIELIRKSPSKFQKGIFLNYGSYTGKTDIDTFYSYSNYNYFQVGGKAGYKFKISKKFSYSEELILGYSRQEKKQYDGNIFDPSYIQKTEFIGLDSKLNFLINNKIELAIGWKYFFYPFSYFPIGPQFSTYIGTIDVIDFSISYKFKTSNKKQLPIVKKSYKKSDGFKNYIKPIFISISNGAIFMKNFTDNVNYLSWFKPGYIKNIKAGMHTAGFAKYLKYSGTVINFELSKAETGHNNNGMVPLYDLTKYTGNITKPEKSKYTRYMAGIGRYKIFGKSKQNIWEFYLSAGYIQAVLKGDIIESYNLPGTVIHKDFLYNSVKDYFYGINSNLQFSLNKNFFLLIESGVDYSPLNPNRFVDLSGPFGYNYLPDASGFYIHSNIGISYNFGGRKNISVVGDLPSNK